jgi:hypothetical protein
LAQQVKLETLALLVLPEQRVLLVNKVIPATQVQRVKRVILEKKAQPVILEIPDQQVNEEQLVLLVPLVLPVPLDQQEKLVQRVQGGLPVTQG